MEESVFEPTLLIHDPYLVFKAQKSKVLRHLTSQVKKIQMEIEKLNRYIEIFDVNRHLDPLDSSDDPATQEVIKLERESRLVKKVRPMLT